VGKLDKKGVFFENVRYGADQGSNSQPWHYQADALPLTILDKDRMTLGNVTVPIKAQTTSKIVMKPTDAQMILAIITILRMGGRVPVGRDDVLGMI